MLMSNSTVHANRRREVALETLKSHLKSHPNTVPGYTAEVSEKHIEKHKYELRVLEDRVKKGEPYRKYLKRKPEKKTFNG
jgi:hypothetical protein